MVRPYAYGRTVRVWSDRTRMVGVINTYTFKLFIRCDPSGCYVTKRSFYYILKKLIKNSFTQLIFLTICKYNYKKMSKLNEHIVKGILLFKVGDITGKDHDIF